MSIFTVVDKDFHSFAAWSEKELAKFMKEAPTVAKVTDTVIDYVGPILEEVVTAEAGGAAGTLVTGVINEVQTDLVVVGGLVYDIGAAPTVAAKVQAMQTDLQGLLTAGHIKNSSSVSMLTLVIREFGALFAAFSAKPAPAAAPAA